MSDDGSTPSLPSAIYVWLVPREDVLDQPGSWRIRKWDTEPFPEANFAASKREDPYDDPLFIAVNAVHEKERRTSDQRLTAAATEVRKYREALERIVWTKDCGIDGVDHADNTRLVNYPDAERDEMYRIAKEALSGTDSRSKD